MSRAVPRRVLLAGALAGFGGALTADLLGSAHERDLVTAIGADTNLAGTSRAGSAALADGAPSPGGSPSPSGSPSTSDRTVAEPLTAAQDGPSAAYRSFPTDLAAYLRTRPGTVTAAGVNLRTGVGVEYRATTTTMTASIVKVAILGALLLTAQDAGRSLTSRERSLASAMITRSDNNAADVFWSRLGGTAGMRRLFPRLGLTKTVPGRGPYWGTTLTSPADQLRLLHTLVDDDSVLSAGRRQYVLELMEAVVRGQRWGVSAAGTSTELALKNGWLPAQADRGLWVINSIGRVTLKGGDVALIAVQSRRSPSQGAGISTVEGVARLVGGALG